MIYALIALQVLDAVATTAEIWRYVRYNGGGNLWVTITMINDKRWPV